MSRISPKQETFCQEYIKDLNGSAAAIRAGYSRRGARRSASRMLTQPHIRARVEELKAQRAEATKMDAEYVLRELAANVIDARKDGDWNASNRALELIGKHISMFPDKVSVDFRDVASLTDEELEAEARKLRLVS